MKVILENKDTIELSKVTEKHILVAVINGRPYIYTFGDYDNLKTSQMLCVSDGVSIGNRIAQSAYK